MIHFIKNNLHALIHFGSPSGRDSRQAFCDIYKGSILLALLGVFVCMWRNTITLLYVRNLLILSESACWMLLGVFELIILLSFICATMRRWQDLDIRIPQHESLRELVARPRFWQVLTTVEGSTQTNQHGPAPKENPKPLLDSTDLQEIVKKKLFTDDDGFEELK